MARAASPGAAAPKILYLIRNVSRSYNWQPPAVSFDHTKQQESNNLPVKMLPGISPAKNISVVGTVRKYKHRAVKL